MIIDLSLERNTCIQIVGWKIFVEESKERKKKRVYET